MGADGSLAVRRAWLILLLVPIAQATEPVEQYDIAFWLEGEPMVGKTVELHATGHHAGFGRMAADLVVPDWIPVTDPVLWIEEDGFSSKSWNITIPQEGMWPITFRAADGVPERRAPLPALVVDSRTGSGTSWTQIDLRGHLPGFHLGAHPWANDTARLTIPATDALRGLPAHLFVGGRDDLVNDTGDRLPLRVPEHWPRVTLGEQRSLTFDMENRSTRTHDGPDTWIARLYVPELDQFIACYALSLDGGNLVSEGHCDSHRRPGEDRAGDHVIAPEMKWRLGKHTDDAAHAADKTSPGAAGLVLLAVGIAMFRRRP